MKIPEYADQADSYIEKAINLDTVQATKIKTVKDLALSLANSKKYAQAGKWYGKILSLDSNYGKTDLFYAGYDDYLGGNYVTADSVFKLYQQKYPEDVYGWYLDAHTIEAIDTAQTGMAKPLYQKVIEIGDTTQDKASIKDKLVPSYRYMVAYYYNLKHQTDSAIIYNNKILEIDSTDAIALKTKDALETVLKQQKEAVEKQKEAADKPSATKKK